MAIIKQRINDSSLLRILVVGYLTLSGNANTSGKDRTAAPGAQVMPTGNASSAVANSEEAQQKASRVGKSLQQASSSLGEIGGMLD